MSEPTPMMIPNAVSAERSLFRPMAWSAMRVALESVMASQFLYPAQQPRKHRSVLLWLGHVHNHGVAFLESFNQFRVAPVGDAGFYFDWLGRAVFQHVNRPLARALVLFHFQDLGLFVRLRRERHH